LCKSRKKRSEAAEIEQCKGQKTGAIDQKAYSRHQAADIRPKGEESRYQAQFINFCRRIEDVVQ
jgi:hypothetical protein